LLSKAEAKLALPISAKLKIAAETIFFIVLTFDTC
jgi:hypothetical protein